MIIMRFLKGLLMVVICFASSQYKKFSSTEAARFLYSFLNIYMSCFMS